MSGAAGVSGISTKATVLDTAQMQPAMGVLFRAGGARPFFDFAADELLNCGISLDLAWGHRVPQLCDRLREASAPAERFRLMEEALLQAQCRRAKRRMELHPSVVYALEKFRRAPGMVSILQVTREAGLSRRRFAQLFREQIGLTPKLYCRLRRFQAVVGQVARGELVDWADVAASAGFTDQAHLVHEFREFSGLTPGAYLAAQRSSANHVIID